MRTQRIASACRVGVAPENVLEVRGAMGRRAKAELAFAAGAGCGGRPAVAGGAARRDHAQVRADAPAYISSLLEMGFGRCGSAVVEHRAGLRAAEWWAR